MKIEVFDDGDGVAREAARLIAAEARIAVAARLPWCRESCTRVSVSGRRSSATLGSFARFWTNRESWSARFPMRLPNATVLWSGH